MYGWATRKQRWLYQDLNPTCELFQAMANETLDKLILEIDERSAATIMMVSGGYPEDYEKGKVISGLDKVEGSIVFHAGH